MSRLRGACSRALRSVSRFVPFRRPSMPVSYRSSKLAAGVLQE
jgi:hypothetical protein